MSNNLTVLSIVLTLHSLLIFTAEPPNVFTIQYTPKSHRKQPEQFTLPLELARPVPLFQAKMDTIVGNPEKKYHWQERNRSDYQKLKNYFRFIYPALKKDLGNFSSEDEFRDTIKSLDAMHAMTHFTSPTEKIAGIDCSEVKAHYFEALKKQRKKDIAIYGAFLYVHAEYDGLYRIINDYEESIKNTATERLREKKTAYDELCILERLTLKRWSFFGIPGEHNSDTRLKSLPHITEKNRDPGYYDHPTKSLIENLYTYCFDRKIIDRQTWQSPKNENKIYKDIHLRMLFELDPPYQKKRYCAYIKHYLTAPFTLKTLLLQQPGLHIRCFLDEELVLLQKECLHLLPASFIVLNRLPATEAALCLLENIKIYSIGSITFEQVKWLIEKEYSMKITDCTVLQCSPAHYLPQISICKNENQCATGTLWTDEKGYKELRKLLEKEQKVSIKKQEAIMHTPQRRSYFFTSTFFQSIARYAFQGLTGGLLCGSIGAYFYLPRYT